MRREEGQQKMTSTDFKPATQQKSGRLYAMVGFLVLLSATYYLRREVLALNQIRFAADQARAVEGSD